ncbi:UvrD-helicase domain-containing protein [Euzebyella saccharophila]|uniref:DNA 3'-5' helicase n=1 Tax=Euzebyella saccharophila TaxID=679664 RepID=A0ABV8JQT0_9FLAO|nr:ATP-dependent helicase [Euzebyella saccharophila]
MSFKLDDKRKSILKEEKDILIIGGPGSGKTTISLLKAFTYIEKHSINRGQQVLFLSFSRNAKARIIESAEKFDKYKNLRLRLNVQTFHGFFLEIVKSHGYLLGAKKKISIVPPHDEAVRRIGRNEDDPDWLDELQINFIKEGELIFDDFAPKALEILTRSTRILELYAKKFPLIIVDEAQDTDALQWGIIQCFVQRTQLLILADLQQQIYDYRAVVNTERLNEIKEKLNPIEFNLETDNYRSPNKEILLFAQDMFNKKKLDGSYKGVQSFKYSPRNNDALVVLRRAIGIIYRESLKETSKKPESIAILCTTNVGVKSVSRLLRDVNIPHKYQFDQVATNISSRLIACLLEPVLDDTQHLLFCLFIVKEFFSSKGNLKEVAKFEKWIDSIKEDKKVAGTFVPAIKKVIDTVKNQKFSGSPGKDWRFVQSTFKNCGNKGLAEIAKHSENLVAFNRGKNIMAGLTKSWDANGLYIDARGILQNALVETQISNTTPKQSGISLMNMHQSKGKEFDAVILFEHPYTCSFELRGDSQDLFKIRKLLFVACTRAKEHLIILTQFGSNPSVLR